VAGLHARGTFLIPRGTAAPDAATLSHAVATGITDATRPALLIAAGFVTVGAFLSLLLPRSAGVPRAEPLVEELEAIEPVERDHALLDAPERA